MRRIPDIIIVVGVIVAAAAIGAGYRWVGVISMLIALIVGWKRNWCMESVEAFASRKENADSGYDGSDSASGDASGGDED